MAANTEVAEENGILEPPAKKRNPAKRRPRKKSTEDSKAETKAKSPRKSAKKPAAKKTRAKSKKTTNAKTKAKAELPGTAMLRREVGALSILMVALCIALSLISYSVEGANLIGPLGHFGANTLLYMFGIGAFFFDAVLWFLGGSLLVGRPVRWSIGEVVGQLLFVGAGTVLSHLAFAGFVVLGHMPGGMVGQFAGELFQSGFGAVGTSIVMSCAALLGLMLLTQLSLGASARAGLNLLDHGRAYVAHKWAVHKEYKERLAEERQKFDSEYAKPSLKQDAKSEALLEATPIVESPDFSERFEDDVESKLSKKLGRMIRRKPVTEPPVEAKPKRAKKKPNVKEKISAEVARDSGWELGDVDVSVNGTEPDELIDDPNSDTDILDLAKEKSGPPVMVKGPAADFGPAIVESAGAKKARERKEKIAEGVVFKPQRKGDFELPNVAFLDYEPNTENKVDTDVLRAMAARIEQTLSDFKIDGSVVEICPGPVITMFEFSPAPGVRVSRIATLVDDLAMALAATSVRIVAPIPGKSVVGIEVPNPTREMVYLKEIIADDIFTQNKKMQLPLALGVDVEGSGVVADLAKMPHLLVAGATGSGKSVAVNTMICSLLFKHSPEDVRMIMVDPKMLEFSLYEDIPHLLLPVVTDPKQATVALNWAVMEMERRYQKLADFGVRNIKGYNAKVEKVSKQAELDQLNGMDESDALKALGIDETGEAEHTHLPYIVVIIDEFADLMMTAAKDVETAVARLAQKARAAGIHLILATQRPSTDVITGLIKANFPTRFALRVTSKTDSRVILDSNGAENLLGNGDALFVPPGSSALQRVHGAYVSEEEIERVVAFLKEQAEAQYDVSILEAQDDDKKAILDEDRDEHYEQAVRLVVDSKQASISMIQRKLRVGYNRAARMVEMMEAEGLVSPAFGCKPREVLIETSPY